MTATQDIHQAVINALVHNHCKDRLDAEHIYSQIAPAPSLLNSFLLWLDHSDPSFLPENQVEGHSVAALVRERGFEPIAAFLTIADFLLHPAEAKAFFDEGYDDVIL